MRFGGYLGAPKHQALASRQAPDFFGASKALGSLLEYGLGTNFNITDTTYVWADVERTAGSVLDTDWRATVGVRHSF